MADVTAGGITAGRGGGCNETCGCPSPCPGGEDCRCYYSAGESESTTGEMQEHKRCSCGEHCGCNPCRCPKSDEVSGVGKAHCRCGEGCCCVTCSS